MTLLKRKSAISEYAPRHKESRKRARIDAKTSASQDGHRPKKPPPTKSPSSVSPAAILFQANEQPAFPRGGGGILTPIEKKQIHARATRDALREQKSAGDLFELHGS